MLCNFAHDFSAFVEDLLEKETGLRRRFREETISDLWVGSLVALRSYGVHVDLADEGVTGADIEIWFVSSNRKYGVGFVIQAKRSHCSTQKRNHKACMIDWKRHRYQELDHAAGKDRPKGSQARDLTHAAKRSGRPLYPLYAFYNPKHIRQSSGHIRGVMLADALEVRKRIVAGRKEAWKKRRFLPGGRIRRGDATYKRLEKLHDLFFPLTVMFCTGSWINLKKVVPGAVFDQPLLLRLAGADLQTFQLPDPKDVVASMQESLLKTKSGPGREVTSETLPEITEDIPSDILELSEGQAGRQDDALVRRSTSRNRIVFVGNDFQIEGEPA